MTIQELIQNYILLGFTHVIPYGFDHILFILAIYLIRPSWKPILLQCTVFTIAHSLTLALTVTGHVIPRSDIVEPVIALSILVTALGNLMNETVNTRRLLVIFVFGLVHGLGFAGAFMETGIRESSLALSLLFFNLGVELGQVTVVLFVWMTVTRWIASKPWYRDRVIWPASAVIACIAVYWTIERFIV